MTKNYASTVSRTLDPRGHGLATVVGQHDRKLTDADINLIQDVQDLKRLSILDHTAPSGCLTLTPFTFKPFTEKVFEVPAFDVLFRGEVIRVGGSKSADPLVNRVEVGSPRAWTPGVGYDDGSIYVVFLEMWGKTLSPVTGDGYYVAPNNTRYFWPGGCVEADLGQVMRVQYQDNVPDPFQGLLTTLRVQTQWRLRVERLPSLPYNFEKNRFGLDPDALTGAKMFARGPIPATDPVSDFAFAPLLDITGETTLWRAGDGNAANSLGTVDGYTYATPVALVFQRNSGKFAPDTNPFGCGLTTVQRSGLFADKVSGRLDGRFADIVYADDVVDTRLSVSLTGYDPETLTTQGLTDVVTGVHTTKIARGEAPGCKPTALGSKLPYTVAMANRQTVNVDTVGSWDRWANGFSSDARTYTTSRVVTLADRTRVGANPDTKQPNTNAWGFGDVIMIELDNLVAQGAAIVNVFVQGLSTSPDGSKVPLALYGGQLSVEGLNYRRVRVRIVSNLAKVSMNPGNNPLIITIGVRYPAGGGADLRRVPVNVAGGELFDADTNLTLPVFGVSEYDVDQFQVPRTKDIVALQTYSPFYSASVFGTRVHLALNNSLAAISVGDQQTQLNTFTIPRKDLDKRFFGLYAVTALDPTGTPLHISRREIIGDTMLVVVDGQLDPTKATTFVVLTHRTAQAAVNPPVKGLTALEETVLVGNGLLNDIQGDPRFTVASSRYTGTDSILVLYANNMKIKGFAGTDFTTLIWVRDISGKFVARECTVELFGGIATVTVPKTNVTTSQWFLVASVLPSPSSNSHLMLTSIYVPYQGEGLEGRDYTLVYAPNEAWITTNGTGQAPIVGLQDVFPFNRQFPISPTLPALPNWSDADLKNQALGGELDSNFVAKRFGNVEHTLGARLHTNDFIAPLHGCLRRKIRMTNKAGRRGFTKATPHVGFAIAKPKPKSVLGDNLQSTVAPISLYVNNASGNDANDGVTKATAKKTIHAAIATLPPVLRHPVAIILVDTGYAYTIKDLQRVDFAQALLGDGETRSTRYYCLGHIAFVMQESARITIGREISSGNRIRIDASEFTGFGDGPTFAFLVSDSRVIFHGISFEGFTTAATKIIDSDVEFLDCEHTGNLLGFSAEQGSLVTLNGGVVALSGENIGGILASSSLRVSKTTLKVLPGGTPGAFFVGERSSNLNFQDHNVTLANDLESGVTAGHVVALARTSSTITCEPTWISNGKCVLQTNSTLVRSVGLSPFRGGLDKDASSNDAPTL